MDYIIVTKEERAFICSPLAKELSQETQLALSTGEDIPFEVIFSFNEGSIVVDDSDNLHEVKEIIMDDQDWLILDKEGNKISILDLKGTLIKEVPKYHIDGLLS